MLRVALVVPNAFDLVNFRRPLIAALREAGAEVLGIAPPGPWAERVEGLGCTYIPWRLRRPSAGLAAEAASVLGLYRIFTDWRPVLVHHFTIKPNVYGTLAARAAGIPVSIVTVTGLGYLWIETSTLARFARSLVSPLYRGVIRWADAVIFLNEEDRLTLGDGRATVVLPGEGVDLSRFHPSAARGPRLEGLRRELALAAGAPVVLMVSRILRHKGVGEFASAAERVRQQWPGAAFLLVGPRDDGNPACVPASELRSWETRGGLRYLGPREDVVALIALADVVVLPSYREGMPRSLMEGAAMGKPLVATDAPGCRDIVHHGVNGFRVRPRDPIALAEAIEVLLDAPEQRASFGRNSRALAEARFDDRRIALQVLALYRRLLCARGVVAPTDLEALASVLVSS